MSFTDLLDYRLRQLPLGLDGQKPFSRGNQIQTVRPQNARQAFCPHQAGDGRLIKCQKISLTVFVNGLVAGRFPRSPVVLPTFAELGR